MISFGHVTFELSFYYLLFICHYSKGRPIGLKTTTTERPVFHEPEASDVLFFVCIPGMFTTPPGKPIENSFNCFTWPANPRNLNQGICLYHKLHNSGTRADDAMESVKRMSVSFQLNLKKLEFGQCYKTIGSWLVDKHSKSLSLTLLPCITISHVHYTSTEAR